MFSEFEDCDYVRLSDNPVNGSYSIGPLPPPEGYTK